MPTKFGQNFLNDPHWQKRIVDWFQPKGDVVEIGPGRGALTQHLEKRFESFLVIEIDRELEERHQNKKYDLLLKDFLKWDFTWKGCELREVSFISNLPYETGTKILERILDRSECVPHFVFMLQKEVIERISAKTHTKNFGSLSVLSQGLYEIEVMGTLPPGAFSPPPKVYSAVIRGNRRELPLIPRTPEFKNFVRKAFQLKRKTLPNSLKSFIEMDKIREALEAVGVNPKARAEEVPVEKWAELYAQLFSSYK